MNTDTVRYAGFWRRLVAGFLDFVAWTPFMLLDFWGISTSRWFGLCHLIPRMIFGLFFYVYLVRRYGGTPGKLMVGIRIRKLNGESVGYREAFLRYSVNFILDTAISAALIVPLFHMTNAEYHALSFMKRSHRLIELAPAWRESLAWVAMAWGWGEFIVLLTNRKRRALHDFIAGTVVVYLRPAPDTELKPAVTAPVV